MKTKFYKRLVPLALIASMAVTNVGITSASANTPVAIEQTTGMDAPVVGTGSADFDWSNKGNAFGISTTTYTLEYGTSDSTAELLITFSDDTDLTGFTNEDFQLTNGQKNSSKVTYAESAKADSVNVAGKSIKFDVPLAKFNEQHEDLTAYVYVKALTNDEAESASFNKIATDLTLKYKAKQTTNPSTPAQQQTVAAGDAFQIPGGLASKGTTVNAYTVGVAKVVASSAKDNEVLRTSIKSTGDGKNVLGTWEAEPEVGDYVLYYVPNGSEAKTFVRMLTNDEAAKLPKEAFKTKTNLTTYKADASNEDKEKTDQFKIEAKTKTALDTIITGTNNAWTAAYSAVAAVVAEGTDLTDKHHIDVPGITLVDADHVMTKDEALIEKLIAAYDEKHESAKFNDQWNGNEGVETALVTKDEVEEGADQTYTPTSAGFTALLEILKTDYKGFMTADGVAETTTKFYNEVYAKAEAEYINAANDAIYTAEPDLSLVQWTMETLSGDKGTDAKGREVYTKTNGNAKFWGKNLTKKTVKGVTSTVEAAKDAASARVKGATASITATKAASKFNNTVYLKAVTDAYVTPTAKTEAQAANVIFTEQFFVTPALPTAFTDKSLTPPAAKAGIKLEKAADYADTNEGRKFKLTLDAGKSFKLPFALKDGVEKDLVYEAGTDAEGFTVVNGKVTATDANTGSASDTIKVYSRVLGEDALYATVTVKVDEAVKSTRANTTSMVVWPGSSQQITLGTNPASKPGDFKYKITNGDTTNLEVKAMRWAAVHTGEDDNITTENQWKEVDLENGFLPNDSCVLVVKEKEGGDASKVAKNTAIKVELYKSDGTTKVDSIKKDLEIKVTGVTAPQDYKGVKTAVKSKETTNDGTKIINVPVGGSVNLGYAVTPAAANATITSKSDNPAKAVINGDVVYGVAEGEANVTLTPNGNIAYGFKSKDTTNGAIKYKINVYNPGSSIVLPNDDDNNNYVIKGGFLMEEGAAATTCNKDFPAGKAIVLDAPTAGTTEEIIWKANNPAAVKIVQSDGDSNDLRILPAIPGTYTITGTTKYTNQSLKFKINVVANATDAEVAAAKNDATLSIDSENLTVGEKANAFFVVPNSTTGGVGAKVTFESSDKAVAVISGNGTITAKAAGTTNITAKMANGAEKTVPLTVLPAAVTTKSVKCAEGAIAGEQFAVSAAFNKFDKKTMELEWYAVAKNADADAEKIASTNFTALAKDKLSGKVSFKDAGSYDIYVSVKESKSGGSVLETAKVGTVNVYANAVKAANVNNADADTKKAIAALGGKNDPAKENTKFNGAGNKQTYYVPVFVTPKADDKPVPAATADDVTFNISNKSLASAKFIPKDKYTDEGITAAELNTQENDIVKDYEKAYGLIKIETTPDAEENKISGVVTVKAILKNSNKTVSVKLNVLNKSLTAQMAYDPQSVTGLATDTGVNLAAVVDAGATDAKPMYDNTEKVKAIANSKTKDNATFKVWKYVLVNDSNVKNVNKAQATKMIDTATVTVGAANQTTGLSNVKFTFPQGVTAPTDGTWYLALAESTIKVTKKAVKADANATPAVAAADAEYSQSAITVKKIASKTPITKIAATTGDDTSGDGDNTNTDGNNG